jgi:Ankyrin repeats (3 copies)
MLEMVEVLAINWDREEPQFDPQNRLLDPNDISTICSTLVATSETTGYRFGSEELTTFITPRLAHLSVKEYIISDRIKNSKASTYNVMPISANIFIARTYLVYLLNSEFEAGHGD